MLHALVAVALAFTPPATVTRRDAVFAGLTAAAIPFAAVADDAADEAEAARKAAVQAKLQAKMAKTLGENANIAYGAAARSIVPKIPMPGDDDEPKKGTIYVSGSGPGSSTPQRPMSNARKAQLKLMMQQEREKEAMEAARAEARANERPEDMLPTLPSLPSLPSVSLPSVPSLPF